MSTYIYRKLSASNMPVEYIKSPVKLIQTSIVQYIRKIPRKDMSCAQVIINKASTNKT